MSFRALTTSGAGLVAVLLLLTGCGSEDPETPAACRGASGAYLEALEVAPGDVRLAGETPISDCLVPGQQAGELEQIGVPLVEAATRLNKVALTTGAEQSAIALGYLVGAVERGATETGGVHAELLRRIEAAARYSPGGKPLPLRFRAGFEKGYAAGLESG